MAKMISVQYKGKEVYYVDATLVAKGEKTNRVSYKGKVQFWPVKHAEMVSPGRWAVDIEFFDIMYHQDLFKKTTMVKRVFVRNKQKIPVPKLRISKN